MGETQARNLDNYITFVTTPERVRHQQQRAIARKFETENKS